MKITKEEWDFFQCNEGLKLVLLGRLDNGNCIYMMYTADMLDTLGSIIVYANGDIEIV